MKPVIVAILLGISVPALALTNQEREIVLRVMEICNTHTYPIDCVKQYAKFLGINLYLEEDE